MIRTTMAIWLVASAAVADPAAGGDLQPRRELTTPPVVAQPEYPHRLIVKFRDAAKVRSTARGLASLTGGDLGAVDVIARAHGAAFSQLIDLPQATLDSLERRAARVSGLAQPDLAGMMVVHAPAHRLEQVANELNALELTEFVYFEELAPPPPCTDIPPVTPLYNALQDYHGPDPGLNMTGAWAWCNARGAGITIADCEYGYNLNHEDLCDIIPEPGQTIHPQVIANGWDEHGTAVLGELVSLDNGYGCIGLVPETEALFFTEWSVEEGTRRATAIANAIASVGAGDIVVLEMQTTGPGGGLAPAELDPAVWTLVRNATDSDIVVVAAAGNGNQDLDSPAYQEYRDRGDSGAIIVGAGSADTQHGKLSFSTYGSRVNVQGWGQSVFTLGYGSYAEHGGDKNQRYRSTFSGTSSATPMVAAACAAVQGYVEENLGYRLLPAELRDLLIDTGIPQGGAGGHIGPFPNVLLAATTMAPVAALDIKPGSCPNSFNRNSNGVLPVALVGSEVFDVMDVDLGSVYLMRADGIGGAVPPHEGPPGPHSVYADVATPFLGETCECDEVHADGTKDLSMKFKSADVVAALELDDLPAGDLVELVVSGQLLDGSEFSASDCIRLVPPGTAPGAVAVSANLAEVWVDAAPLDETLEGGGFTDFMRIYPAGTEVTLSAPLAPANHPGWVLDRWYVNGTPMPPGTTEMTFENVQSVQSMELIYCDGQPCPCPWDLDGDGTVTVSDILRFLAAWGANPGHPADFDGNGTVGITDFLLFLANWASCL